MLAKEDLEKLDRWENGEYNSPIKIKEIEGKGLGVVAVFPMSVHQLVCTYSGDVLPSNFPGSGEYRFQYSYGPRTS